MTFPPRQVPPAGGSDFRGFSGGQIDKGPFTPAKGKPPKGKGKKKLLLKKKPKKPPMPPRRPAMPIADDDAGTDY